LIVACDASLVDNTTTSLLLPDAPAGGAHWIVTCTAGDPLARPVIGTPDNVANHDDHVDVWLAVIDPDPMFEIAIDVVCGDVIDPMLIVLPIAGVDANTGPVPLHARLKLIVACVASLVVNVSVSMCMPYGDPTGGLHTIVMLCVDGLTRLLIGMLDVTANQLDANVVNTFNMP
jgi:hypothetical protein